MILLKSVCSTNSWRGVAYDSVGVASSVPPEFGEERFFRGINIKKGMSVKTEDEAGVVSIRDNPDKRTTRINLRWEGNHQISDFDLDRIGKVLNSEDETEHTGWVLAELPLKASVGTTIPLLKGAQ